MITIFLVTAVFLALWLACEIGYMRGQTDTWQSIGNNYHQNNTPQPTVQQSDAAAENAMNALVKSIEQ